MASPAAMIDGQPYGLGSAPRLRHTCRCRAGRHPGASSIARPADRSWWCRSGPSAIVARALKLGCRTKRLLISGDLRALPATAAFLRQSFPAAVIATVGAKDERVDWAAADFVFAPSEVAMRFAATA